MCRTKVSTTSYMLMLQEHYTFMMKNDYLDKKDVVGSQYFQDANGNVSEGTVINIRQVDFGGMKLENVRASVVRNQKAPLLFGQSVLARLGKIEIDNSKHLLKITHTKQFSFNEGYKREVNSRWLLVFPFYPNWWLDPEQMVLSEKGIVRKSV